MHSPICYDLHTLTAHSPHTEPDPRVEYPPPEFSHHVSLHSDAPPDHHVSISQDRNCTLSHSPQSPHTRPDPRVQVPPIYSLPVPSLLGILNRSLNSSPPHSPHTAPVQFVSPNPNPQLGEAQLDFIPSPISIPSAPSEQSLMIPDADDDAKYETLDLDRRNSCSTLSSTIPSASNDTKYEMEDNSNRSLSLSSSSISTLARSVPSPPDIQTPHGDDEKAGIKKGTSANAVIDTDLGKYELNPLTNDKGTFVQTLRNQRTKILWIASLVALAVMFGVLSVTVWRLNYDKSAPNSSDNNSVMPSVNNGTTNTNNGTVSTNSNNISTNTNNDSMTASNNNATATKKKEEWYKCRTYCSASLSTCPSICRNLDAAYLSCDAACQSNTTDTFCNFNCERASSCYQICDSGWGKCAQECPSPF